MKKLFLIFALFTSVVFAKTEVSLNQPLPPISPAIIDVQALTMGQLSAIYYKEVFERQYVLCDAVITDTRLVSIRAVGKQLDAAFYHKILDLYGYQSKENQGVFYVCTKDQPQPLDYGDAFLYKPQYRDVDYLVGLVQPLIKGTFANKRSNNLSTPQPINPQIAGSLPTAAPQTSVSNQVSVVGQNPYQNPNLLAPLQNTVKTPQDDYIIFLGADSEKSKLKKILTQLDTPTGEVVLKGHVYEVGKTGNNVSGLDMFIAIFKQVMPQVITANIGGSMILKNVSLDYVSSVLSSDGHFSIVTSPYTRVKSGSTARFVVGSDVPVLGAIVTTGTGTSTQSVEYKSSGSLFEVSPKVHEQAIDVDIFQQISSFTKTTTGVNGSPTLNKRELRTSLTVQDSELLVIGGLNDNQKSTLNSWPWPLPFINGTSTNSADTELILLLEVKKL